MLLNKLVQKAREIEESLNKELSQSALGINRAAPSQIPVPTNRLQSSSPPAKVSGSISAPVSPSRPMTAKYLDMAAVSEVDLNFENIQEGSGADGPPPLPQRSESEEGIDSESANKQEQKDFKEGKAEKEDSKPDLKELSKEESQAPKSSIQNPIRTGELDGNSKIRLEKLVQTLENQLKLKENDFDMLQMNFRTLKSDKDKLDAQFNDKMSKVKQLLMQASKTSSEQKDLISKKDDEISLLAEELKQIKIFLEDLKKEKNFVSENYLDLLKKYEDVEAVSQTKIQELERKLEKQTSELNSCVAEFQSYKLRAYSLLKEKQNGESAEKISELETRIHSLESENFNMQRNNTEYLQKIQELESLVKSSFEQLRSMEVENRNLSRDKKELEDIRNSLSSKLDSEKIEFAEKLKQQERHLSATIENVKTDLSLKNEEREQRLKEKENEASSLQTILEHVSNELSDTRSELFRLRDEFATISKESQKIREATTIMETEKILNEPQISTSTPITTSLEDFFNNSPNKPSLQWREYEHRISQLSESLEEAESNIERLKQQEKILKEEIRKYDRLDQRQYVNMEYLKNIVLKFLEAPTEPLVPVLSKVLHLDPSEADQMRISINNRKTQLW